MKSSIGAWSTGPQLPTMSGVPATPAPPKPQTGSPASATPWGGVRAPSLGLEPEYHDAYYDYIKNKSPESASRILNAVSPVIDKALKSYAGGEGETPTMRARAKTLTLEAVRRYDPTKAKLSTHLLSHLRGLRRITERATSAVYIPEGTKIDARKLDATRADMADELGREPSDAELSARIGIPLDRIVRARTVPGVLSASQTGGEVGAVDKVDPRSWDAWVRAIHADSGPIDQVILEHSFGMFGKPALPANEIAARLNLSPAAISLRKQRLQADLDMYQTFLGGSNANS